MIPKIRRPAQRRMIPLEVRANERLTPHFARLTLTGESLSGFAGSQDDQTVRLFFPRNGQKGLWLPSRNSDVWMAETLLQPKTHRPWVRNYTVREFRPEAGELDIEFALHGDAGPASAWAARARPGDPAGIFDEGNSYLPPENAYRQLLVGDESAVPAILSILAGAPETLTGDVFLEVPTSADIRTDVVRPPGVHMNWVSRDAAESVPGARVLAEVRGADLKPADYTWVAGESKLATGLRRHLVNDRGVAKSAIAFIGYWRHGRSSPG
ncbi:NADPH-dependent ferric siderophore reductase [Actinoplanes lutulentus]|uniref:NADPH-dependent ferric siderophore reductase n=1 Tax=Actinoplanes lutulentus TaxID=1287878 RepID=A0A327Z207_9ACTN|nr:siderophore-interacting protein [Actinoplanes lutulentus]MBB2948994.1 NADPH-dependent ferric siderophore reductase [Actinoplanes lutulentus]RAK26227.1 NADPH-dependent ferric siderophore reductase [Actinoplanes lutulentus]